STAAKAPIAELPKNIITPSNQDQEAGFVGGQIAQTIATAKPTAKVVSGVQKITEGVGTAVKLQKAGKIGKVAQNTLNLAGRATAEAGVGYGVTKVQGGSDNDAKRAAII